MNVFLVYLVINSPQDFGYNYGLGYISAVLKEKKHTVSYIVIRNEEDIVKFCERIKEANPGVIGFSATTTQFSYLRNITERVRKLSNAFLVCGGIHPTLNPNCILEVPELNAIVRGEGEYAFSELLAAIEDGGNYFNIRNIWFKRGKEVIQNEIRPLIQDLNELPFPDKDSLDYQSIINFSSGHNRFIFSRGCLFDCSYCSNKALSDFYGGKYFRSRSPEKAIEEISLNENIFKFNSIGLDDDIITIDKDWFYKFFPLYKKNFKYNFSCNVRPGVIDKDMVRLLKESGCRKVAIGVEHGSEEFRKKVLNRNITNKQIIEAFDMFKTSGINCLAQIMVGLPFETRKLYFETVRLARKINPEMFSISIFTPYPATELGEVCRMNEWLPGKLFYRERQKAVISYPDFTKEAIQMCHDIFPVYMKFRFLPLRIPQEWVLSLLKFYRSIKDSMFSKKSEINQSNVRKCVVSFGINSLSPKDCPPKIWQDFPRGVRRIRERLKELYFKGDFIGWDKDYPPGTPPFKEVGDRLKPFCFLDAWRNGYDLVLFVDSSVYFNVSPEPLFKLIEKRGYFFVATGYSIGSYCSDAALKALGISRKESFSIKCCMSTIMGLDLRNENSRIFLQEYIKQATEGTAFEGAKWSGVRGYPVTVSTDPRVVGHRRQVVPSVIAYKLGMKRLMRRKDVYKYIIIDRKYVRSYDEDCGKIENASV